MKIPCLQVSAEANSNHKNAAGGKASRNNTNALPEGHVAAMSSDCCNLPFQAPALSEATRQIEITCPRQGRVHLMATGEEYACSHVDDPICNGNANYEATTSLNVQNY